MLVENECVGPCAVSNAFGSHSTSLVQYRLCSACVVNEQHQSYFLKAQLTACDVSQGTRIITLSNVHPITFTHSPHSQISTYKTEPQCTNANTEDRWMNK